MPFLSEGFMVENYRNNILKWSLPSSNLPLLRCGVLKWDPPRRLYVISSTLPDELCCLVGYRISYVACFSCIFLYEGWARCRISYVACVICIFFFIRRMGRSPILFYLLFFLFECTLPLSCIVIKQNNFLRLCWSCLVQAIFYGKIKARKNLYFLQFRRKATA